MRIATKITAGLLSHNLNRHKSFLDGGGGGGGDDDDDDDVE